MGYYTTFSGVIDYSDVTNEKQEIIEKIFDVIEFMQWGCSSRSGYESSIKFYNEENEWIHFLYNINIDKKTKIIDFECERKDYNEATATLLSLIAPYLNPNKEFIIEYNGEDDFDYDDNDEEIEPTPNEMLVKDGKVYLGSEIFQTDNKLSFPLPTISNR